MKTETDSNNLNEKKVVSTFVNPKLRAMCKYEVTRELYSRFLGTSVSVLSQSLDLKWSVKQISEVLVDLSQTGEVKCSNRGHWQLN